MYNLFEINQLSLSFHSKNKTLNALDKVSFQLAPGETVVLLGESGCGKSLTSLALMRLLPEAAVYGANSSINLDGEDILNLPEHLMRVLRGRRLAMIFQEPMTALNPVMTIGAQLAEVLFREHSFSRQALHKKLIALLLEVELPEPEIKIHQYPHQYQGGKNKE
jgi:ABC-type microcin C transport system duplicated ATPase subunit YejF